MAFVCLPSSAAESFKKALAGKDIQIADLLNPKMSSEARTAIFREFAGSDANAKAINTLFEEKLVLKNKVLGLKNFISKVAQEGKYSPERIAELKKAQSDYVAAQQERIFNPAEEQTFLNDLADKSIGAHISRVESKTIFDLSNKVDEAKTAFNEKTGEWSTPEAKADYGAKKVVYQNYIDALKEGDTSLKTMLKDTARDFKQEFKTNKPKAVLDILLKGVKTITENSVALVASLDDSFLGRQGLKTLMTHPSAWWPGAKGSIVDFAKTIGGKNTRDALMADLYSSPNYLNGAYEKAGIISKNEEQFPTSLPARIPGVGRVFKASEAAFEGSALRMRTGLYDLLSKQAERNGVDMTDDYQIKSIGKVINSLTARGQWGTRGEPALLRIVLWAPKMLKANIDVLTAHTGQDISSFARAEAAKNLFKIVATSAAIMAIANAIKPGSAETDPRSADFGKIKVGNTRFDFTGGAGSLIVLAARGLTLSTKSTTTGKVTKLNSGQFGSQTYMDVLVSFLEGKTPPITSALISLAKGRDFAGNKPTVSSLAQNQLPITLQNIIGLKTDNSASAVAGILLDAFGVNASTYTPVNKDWTQNPGAELTAFQKKVGSTKFSAANTEYNKKVDTFVKSLQDNAKYKALSDADKQRVIDKQKATIKSDIFKEYGFHYKQVKSTPVPKI